MKNFLTERRIIIGFIITVVFLLMVFFTALTSFKKVRQLAIVEFNQSQLVLARHVSFSLKTVFNTLKQELTILNLSPTIQYLEKVSLANRMRITLSAIQNKGVLEIRRIDGNRVYILNRDGVFKEIRCSGEDLKLFKWAQRPENKGKIYISSISQRPFDASKRLIMHLAIPTYQDSFDEAHPRPTYKFAGCLAFIIDVNKLTEIVASKVRSGNTGYAWVIDESGRFIYHPRKDYIWQNAFFVRKKEAHIPISFARINTIQRENMLSGQEGTSWYISNWHRGVTKKMKKLIAYSPVWLQKEGKPPLWSVAVVAPMQEVKTMISGVYKQQLLLQGLVLLTIVCVSFSVIGFERHYSIQLKKEVEKRTKELRASEERYRMLIENASDLIYLIDTEGKIASINRYGLNFITGDSSVCPEDFIGKNIFSYIRPLDNALTPETIKEKINGAISLEHEVQIGHQKYWFNTSLIPIKRRSGEIAILGISRDITQHKEMAKQLFNTEKLASLGILSAGVAHEINNPIAVILGFADLLLEDGELSAEERQQALKNIQQEAEKCKKIVENLLMFTRFKEYTEEITDVNSNLERVIALVSNNLLIKKIKLEKELSPNLPKIKADAKQIQQVFLNIINNAIQAMPNAGCLKITTRLNSELNMVEIFIKDTGPGIKLQHRRKIFDPFFTTKPEGKGTGLGLFVSYGIITKYGGTIDFETRTEEEDKENHGTTFIIRLPSYISKQGGEKCQGKSSL